MTSSQDSIDPDDLFDEDLVDKLSPEEYDDDGYRYTAKELLAEIHRLANAIEEPPTVDQMDRRGQFSARVYNDRFGSWDEALEAAGFEPNAPGTDPEYSQEELLAALHDLADELERTPKKAEMNEQGQYSARPYERAFGSWSDAIAASDLSQRVRNQPRQIPRDDLLDELRALAEEFDLPPTKTMMNEAGKYRASTYYDRFGTWNDAIREAGLEPRTPGGNRISSEDLLDELRRVASKVDGAPTTSEMDELGDYSSSVYGKRFGSWGEALRRIGLEPN